MRTIFVLLVAGLIVLLGGTSYAADLRPDHKRTHARGAGTFDQRMRVVEQKPYCGDCEAPIGRTHSANVARLRFINWPFWQESCAAGACGGLLSGYAVLWPFLGLGLHLRPERAVVVRQTSTLAASALSWMNCRRGSTRSPINW